MPAASGVADEVPPTQMPRYWCSPRPFRPAVLYPAVPVRSVVVMPANPPLLGRRNRVSSRTGVVGLSSQSVLAPTAMVEARLAG